MSQSRKTHMCTLCISCMYPCLLFSLLLLIPHLAFAIIHLFFTSVTQSRLISPAGKASILVFHGPPPLHIHMSLPVFCLFSVSIHRGKLSQTFFILLSSASQLCIFFLHFSVPFPPNFLSSIYIWVPCFVTLLHICGETALFFFKLSSFHIYLFTRLKVNFKKIFFRLFCMFSFINNTIFLAFK